VSSHFNKDKFSKDYLTIKKYLFFIYQDTMTTSQVDGARETATIQDLRLEKGVASEMIAGTGTETGTGIALVIEGEAETEMGTGAVVSGHVAIMVTPPIGIAIVGRTEIRNVSVQLFDMIHERYISITDIFIQL
jgi:hypothetical protein